MQILLVNDDGIHSPGLQALHAELVRWGDVTVVAPAIEQSGVGHTITYLHPIVVHPEYRNGEFFGWKAEGSPADCVKLGILEFCPRQPDVVISGINAGANVGINVLYSGTVAAAIEGAFFGVPSIALSQWLSGPPNYQKTARNAVAVCRQLLDRWEGPGALWNVNFPPDKPEWPLGVKSVSIAVRRHTDTIEKRIDPRGRTYFWSGIEPIKSHHMDPGSDIEALLDGYVTVTPLHFDLTERPVLDRLQDATWELPADQPPSGDTV